MKKTQIALLLAVGLISSSAVAQTNFWQGTVGTTTSQWSNTATWSLGSVPNSQGAIVSFVADFTATATGINIEANTNYTVGVINMTDSGGGNAGKFNIAGVSTSLLTLDNGANKPIINYTTGGQFDNFMNVVLAGANGFEKTGAGYLQLNPPTFSNTYTGVTKISGGYVRFGRNSQLGDATVGSGVELAGGGGGLAVRQDAGNVVLANGASAKRNVSVTAGTNQINVEGTASLEISGNLTSSASTLFQKTGTGTLILSGSGNSMTGTTEFRQSTVNISGTFNTAGQVVIAKSNNATLDNATVNWSGTGTVATANSATLLLNDGGTAVTNARLNVTAGTLNVGDGVNGGRFIVGGKGVGVADISGGTLSVKANKEVSIGSFAQYGGNGGNGTVTISNGGLFQALGAGNFYVGYGQDATGPGGTAFGGTGVLSLNTGGTLETGRNITTGTNATGTVNFNGGTLKAAANNANLLRTTNNLVGNGGLTVDTAGFNIGISNVLANGGSGGLTKSGSGTLTLGAANTYTGGTAVTAGSLIVNNASGSGTGSGALTISNGATLGGSGIIDGATTVAGFLNPGNSPGDLTFNDALLLESTATLTMEITGITVGQYDRLIGDGANTLTFGGILALDNTGYSATVGDTITLFSNWDTFAGAFDSITGTDLGGGLSWDTSNLGTSGTIEVVPEPGTYALLALAAAGFGAHVLRRRIRR